MRWPWENQRGGQMLKGRNPHGGEVGCTGRPALLGREVPCGGSRKFIRAGMIAPNEAHQGPVFIYVRIPIQTSLYVAIL